MDDKPMTATELGEEALSEAFEYLDELRESGRTNMWGSHAFVRDELMWQPAEAEAAVKYWMNTFSDAPVAERVAKALAA